MLKRRISLRTNGDTIVEVMVVLAVLGMAIGISYATANRSLLNTRQAQENSEATEYAQQQVEDLYSLASSSTTNNSDPLSNIFLSAPGAPTIYCIDPTKTTPNGPIESFPTNSCTFGNSGLYQVLIYDCNVILGDSHCLGVANNDSDTFVVQATWADVLGNGNDTVTLVYRVHQPS